VVGNGSCDSFEEKSQQIVPKEPLFVAPLTQQGQSLHVPRALLIEQEHQQA
jgi:hypothetical protein